MVVETKAADFWHLAIYPAQFERKPADGGGQEVANRRWRKIVFYGVPGLLCGRLYFILNKRALDSAQKSLGCN